MGITNFPNGLTSFGIPMLGSGATIPTTTGKVFFVHSGTGVNDATCCGKDTSAPFATVAYAITQMTANKGDMCIMMPGHAETVSGTTAWTPKAGSAILGLGWGAARPLITLGGAATSTITTSAAGVMFQNFVVGSGVTELAAGFTVTGTDCIINAVDYREITAVSMISFASVSAAAHRTVITNCRHNQTTAPTGTVAWISILGGDGHTIADNDMCIQRPNNAAACVIGSTAAATTNIVIKRNTLGSLTTGTNLIALSLYAGSTGLVADNRGHNLGKTAIAGGFALAAATGFNNLTTKTANKSGLLDPVVDA